MKSEDQLIAKRLSTATARDLRDETFRYLIIIEGVHTYRRRLIILELFVSNRRRVIESNIEIRELTSKLQMAYVLKERHKQIEEKEYNKMIDLVLTRFSVFLTLPHSSTLFCSVRRKFRDKTERKRRNSCS